MAPAQLVLPFWQLSGMGLRAHVAAPAGGRSPSTVKYATELLLLLLLLPFAAAAAAVAVVAGATYAELMGWRVPLPKSSAWLPTKGTGEAAKHASVSALARGQSLYWYPPPWLARMDHVASTTAPRAHDAAERVGGSTREPRSPSTLWLVLVKKAAPEGCAEDAARTPPPALPHASKTGAVPGARQGLNR